MPGKKLSGACLGLAKLKKFFCSKIPHRLSNFSLSNLPTQVKVVTDLNSSEEFFTIFTVAMLGKVNTKEMSWENEGGRNHVCRKASAGAQHFDEL